jgi:glycosyltransferase involved in cell wall biosynthesis
VNKLAIVIPAYKGRFFDRTLESIAVQTCKDFTLYIGDDASPDDLESIVELYRTRVNIIYKRFSENLGEKTLVAHWVRCVDLVKDEEWVWFFSDDDIMSSGCVEGFYKTLELFSNGEANSKIFRFNLAIADENLNLVQKYVTPSAFSVEYFLEDFFINNRLTVRAVEFVFSKSTYYANGKFVSFPLAWGSDSATILKFGQDEGFITIVGGEVLWHDSGFNISGTVDEALDRQKASAINQYYLWIFDFVQNFNKRPFFYKLVYTIMHHISGTQALTVLKERSIKDLKLNSVIVLLAGFISIKRFVRFAEFRRMILNRSRNTQLKVIS